MAEDGAHRSRRLASPASSVVPVSTMQRLPEDALLKYHPDTMLVVRKMYNLDKPGQMEEAVDILDTWVQKQNHFMKKDFSREHMERVIVQVKGSIERAKSQMDKLCTFRTAMPKFFEITDPQLELKEISGYTAQTPLPTLTKENYRIFMTRINDGETHSQRRFFLTYVNFLLLIEYIKSHDYCDGIISIADIRGINITNFVAELNLTELRQIITIVIEGYAARLKAIHFISTSKAIDLLVNIMKQMFSAKIANRIHVHKTIEELCNHVPQELLPKEYGGDENTLDEMNSKCLKHISSEKFMNHFKEMRNACTDESRRPVSTYNASYMGLAGTFRTLNVD